MKCYIFCSAEIKDYDYLRDIDFDKAYVICADGGIKHAAALGIAPDVWLGDGDSLNCMRVCVKERLDFPERKDNTDTDLAIELAMKRGFADITLIGAIGGRRDHEFSHFCLMKKVLDKGGFCRMIDPKNEIAMYNRAFELIPDDKKYVSFFPFGGDVEDFSVKGLRYTADGMTLRCGEASASSNCFDGEEKAFVSFASGYVLVIRAND